MGVTETKLYGRSAPDILFTGLTNLEKEPLGWLFGTPSALYSNLPAQQPTVLGPFVPEISNGFGDSPMVGRVVPTSTRISTTRVSPRSNAKKSRKSRKALGSRQLGKRVPPSSPEELESARRGEYDYYSE